MFARLIALSIGAWMLIGAAPQQAPSPSILIFSHTTGYRHASIEPATEAIRGIAGQEGLRVVASEDPAIFDDPDGLARFKAIVLLSNTSKSSDPASEWWVGKRRDSLQRFVRGGGGIVAIHAAADSHHHWPWYTQMIGGRFTRHPPGTLEGAVTKTAHAHPSTAAIPDAFRIEDEWYWFTDLSPTVDMLLTLDPASIGEKGANPTALAWAHRFDGGRVFYTGLGHRTESWADARVLAHVRGGLAWTAGTAKASAMVVIDEREKRRDEPPPHGAIGMSTAYRISDGVPARTMEFRRRDLHVGAAIGIHPIDHDEVYYVLSGEGEVTSDGVTRRLKPGMAAYLYTGAEVGIRQMGSKPLSLIVSYPIPGT